MFGYGWIIGSYKLRGEATGTLTNLDVLRRPGHQLQPALLPHQHRDLRLLPELNECGATANNLKRQRLSGRPGVTSIIITNIMVSKLYFLEAVNLLVALILEEIDLQ